MPRSKYDAYQTPAACIESLLANVDLSGINRFLEPCRGNGNIYQRVPAQHKAWCEIQEGKDYLKTRYRKRFDLIITNPPFSHWREFLEKSLSEADVVIYLLRLNTLGSGVKTNRAAFWNTHKPTHLFPLESRPSFKGGGTDMTDYAWFVWDKFGRRVGNSDWLKVI